MDDDLPVDREIGWHVVTVDDALIGLLDEEELTGIRTQRLARQTSWVAPLLSLCAWLALFLGICALLGFAVYAIGRGAVATAANNQPAWPRLASTTAGTRTHLRRRSR